MSLNEPGWVWISLNVCGDNCVGDNCLGGNCVWWQLFVCNCVDDNCLGGNCFPAVTTTSHILITSFSAKWPLCAWVRKKNILTPSDPPDPLLEKKWLTPPDNWPLVHVWSLGWKTIATQTIVIHTIADKQLSPHTIATHTIVTHTIVTHTQLSPTLFEWVRMCLN